MVSSVANLTRNLLIDRSRSRIGVDIGTRMLKFAQCRRVFGSWKVAAAYLQPVAPQQVIDADGLSQGILDQSLGEFTPGTCGFRGRATVAALSSAIVAPRLLEFPESSDSDLSEMVNEECEATESSSVDFWRTRAMANGGRLARVNAVVLAKDHASCCFNGLKKTGLRCESISAAGQAMACAVQLMDPSERPVAVVDWGASAPMVCICRNGRPEFSRVLRHCGLRPVIDAVCMDLGIEECEAAQLLAAYGIESGGRGVDPISSRLSSLLEEHVQRLTNELVRTLEFVQQDQPDSMPEWVCMLGGGSAMAGLTDRLATELNLETRSWKLAPRQLDPAVRDLELQSLFAVAIGLSILEVDR